MRLDYIRPFVDAAVAILSGVTGDAVRRGDMKLRQQWAARGDVAAVVALTGGGDGRVIIEMPRETALALAGAMNRTVFAELDRLALDTLMELANVVVARAVSTLSDRGFRLRLTPPLIFTGPGLTCFSSLNLETLSVPLQGRAGVLSLDVTLRADAS